MTAAREAAPASVTGYVEAMTANAALGWAWIPGDPAPLPVELRLGAQVVSEAVADEPRDDLAQNGIGTGRHAFSLPVPEALRPRLGELRVVARTPDGAAIPLGTPPAADGVAERLEQLARGLEMVVGSQRVLHRNVQAVLLNGSRSEPAGPTAAELATTQATLGEAVATLELFVARLELSLGSLPVPKTPPVRAHWALGTVAGVAAAALVTSVWALFRVLPG